MPLPRNAQRFVGMRDVPEEQVIIRSAKRVEASPEFASDWHPVEPSGGTGLAPAYAEAIGAALRERGFEPVVRETEKDAILLPEEIERAIVVDGDGTLRRGGFPWGSGCSFLARATGNRESICSHVGFASGTRRHR